MKSYYKENILSACHSVYVCLCNLKDIVELAVDQVHTEVTICYLDNKISEHRHRFLKV